MAGLEDILKGNPLTAVAVGLGAFLVAPAGRASASAGDQGRDQGGMLAYQGTAELGEAMGDIVAEAQFELAAQEQTTEAESPTPSKSRPKRQPSSP